MRAKLLLSAIGLLLLIPFSAFADQYDGGSGDGWDVSAMTSDTDLGPDVAISSAASQIFYVADLATAMSTITVTDDPSSPAITAANDIRIRIPSGFNMRWDYEDTGASIGGSASGKVSTTVSYEDSYKTLVVEVTQDFAAGENITISGLSFENFTAPSASDNLELEIGNNGLVSALDDKTIQIKRRNPFFG